MCVFMRAIDKLNGRREREVKKTPCQKSMNVIFNLIKQLWMQNIEYSAFPTKNLHFFLVYFNVFSFDFDGFGGLCVYLARSIEDIYLSSQ